MSCFYPLLMVLIGGCWALPLPSSVTLVWSVQDNGQNQASLLCLVQGISNVGVTMWFSNGNESNQGTLHESRFNIVSTAVLRPSSAQLFFLQYLSPSSPLSARSLKTRQSSSPPSESLPTPTTILSDSPNMHLGSHVSFFPSSEDVNTLIIPLPLNADLSTLILPPILNKDFKTLILPSPSKQDLSAQFSQLVSTENLRSFALLSLPIDKYRYLDSVACFVPETGSDNMLESPEVIFSGEDTGPFCHEEFPVDLALRITQDFLRLLAIRIIVFKLLIFDLLMTGTAILQTYRNTTQTPKYTDQ